MRRDLSGLVAYGVESRPDLTIWDRLTDLSALMARALRRTLDCSDLMEMKSELLAALDEARNILEPDESDKNSTSVAQNEQHYQNSNTKLNDFELRREDAKAPAISAPDESNEETGHEPPALPFHRAKLPNIPLGLVLSTCTEILTYADGGIRHWHDLMRTAEVVRPMMGISPAAWLEAKSTLGPEEAAVVLAAILQRFGEIRSPGGYLRTLVLKAADGAFSSGPMIVALMRREAA